MTRRLGLGPNDVFAAGDHLNDLPMLSRQYARWLAAPANAVEPVRRRVREQGGYVSDFSHGNGISDALQAHLQARPHKNAP